MREDMYKVIVERPRGGGIAPKGRWRAGALDEDAPARDTRPGKGRTKWLNENLAPLRRWLRAQTGRPWDRVYAQLCEGVDRRNTVQRHIHQHIEDFVALQVEADALHYVDHRCNRRALADLSAPALYVDPRSRLLRVNEQRAATRAAWHAEHAARRQTTPPDRRRIAPDVELQRIAGVWYEVRFEPDAGGKAESALKVLPSTPHCSCRRCKAVVARSKRQLGRAELKRSGLANED